MRKFLLALLSVIMLVCAGSAFACSGKDGGGDYHTLTFRKANGVTYVSSINSGKGFTNGAWDIKDGVTVTFTVELADDAVGELEVYCNDDKLSANKNGAYSVKVTEDADIVVDGIDAVGDYNRLIVSQNSGAVVTFINVDKDGSTLKNGMMVRSGTEVQFSVVKADGYYYTNGNAPDVYANGTKLALSNGVYSFVMSEPTTISIEGIQKNINLTFNKGDNRVEYINVKGGGQYFDTDTPIKGELGEEVVFDVKISVYYDASKGYEVQSNTTILSPQSDGHYHITLEDNTTVSVSGLKQDTAFTARGEGSGTQSDPYRLSRPIDLYEMAMRVNDSWYMGTYSNEYYKLVADIDLEDEQLFVIGDGSSSYAYFGGQFDGNGHTISNYYITDTRVDQSEYNQLYLSGVGMFGYVMPGLNRAPVIKDLTLANFTITANGARSAVDLGDYSLCVGSLAGSTFGASISNVSAKNGQLIVTGGKNSGAYVGGLIGQQFAEYGNTYKFDSGVISCMTNVDIRIVSDSSSYVFATGGISGSLIVGDEHYTSYILNCYSTGNVEGGQYAGGIVGYAYDHSAIVNCYSSGTVIAISSLATEGYLESVYYATAGGIAGYAEYSTVIANSFSTGYVLAQSSKGSAYCKASGTVAAKDDESALTDADALLPKFINLYGVSDNADNKISISSINSDFIKGLKWSENDWIISNGLPLLNPNAAKPSINVNFSVNNAFGTVNSVSLDSYKSLAGWDNSDVIPEFISGNGGNRSYGYFFDEQLENKVPRSFVLTSDITLYVGYADYAAISGIYYLGDSVREEVTLELTFDGKAIYRDGALNQTATYSWDGSNLIIYYSAVGALSSNPDIDATYFGSYYIYSGKIEGDIISITGGAIEEIGDDGYTGNIIYIFPEGNPLNGYKQIDGFKYGSYYFDGGEYIFFGNRTGLYIVNNEEKIFSYVFSADNKLTLTIGDSTAEATLDNNGYVTGIGSTSLKAYDEFTGSWEKSFESPKEYTFDGKGGWTYSGFDNTSSGSYKVESGVLSDVLGSFTAKFDDEGFLVVTSNGKEVTYYKEGSFKGEWYFNGLTKEGADIAVGITFDGIGLNGYGNAHVKYPTGTEYELTYECSVENEVKYVWIYYRDSVFGELVYKADNLTLTGTLNGQSVRFTVYDEFLGKWLSDDTDIEYVEFNGNGFYQLSGEGNAVSVRGTVRINGKQRVYYSINRKTMVGSFTYNSVDYTFTYNETTGIITVTYNSNRQFHLALLDSWYGRELKDSEGNIYTFDGKGNLPNGGKITVSDGSSYTYKLNGENIDLNNNSGTITIGSNGGHSVYVLNISGSNKYLTVNTPFTGEWVIGGLSATLTIGEIYADNTASGEYTPYGKSQQNISLIYNPDTNDLTFQYGSTVYRITLTSAGGRYLLNFGSVGGSSSKGIPAELADDLQSKVYSVLDGNGNPDGRKLVFDGLGEYSYANGTAVLLKASGEIEKTFIYSKNDYGHWIVISSFYEYVLVSCDKNTKLNSNDLYLLKDDGGNYFAIISPDGLYGYKVKDALDPDTYYLFDGCGEVKCVTSGETVIVYNYKIIKLNETFKHLLEFTTKDGSVTFRVILDLSGSQDSWNISKSV